MADLPHLIRPMLASLRHELPEDEDSYGWELKWDGLRAVAYVSEGTVRLISRNDKDMAASYPELAVLAERVSAPVILDGEIVALREGRPDFGLLQSRMHVQRPDDKLIRAVPVQIYVFDLLTMARTHCSIGLIPSAGTGCRSSAWTPTRFTPRHGTAAARPACWPTVSPRAWKEWSASRWPLPITPVSAGTGSRSRTSSSRKSSSAAGNPAKAAVRTRSAPCWSASTTATSCDTRDTSAPALPRTCSPT